MKRIDSHLAILALSLSTIAPAFAGEVPAAAPAAPAARVSSGPGLLLASSSEGGYFAAGSTQSFRVLNASPSQSLNAISAGATAKSGFKVTSNGCPQALAPRASCQISVTWIPVGADILAKGSLKVKSGSLEVEAALEGNTALRP